MKGYEGEGGRGEGGVMQVVGGCAPLRRERVKVANTQKKKGGEKESLMALQRGLV